jgi:hypothetical protein
VTGMDLVIQFILDIEGITRLVADKTNCNDWTLIGEIKSGQWRRAGNFIGMDYV